MKKSTILFLIAGVSMMVAPIGRGAEATNKAPDFQEVYELIKTHAAGLDETELNRAAVQGFLAALGPTAALVTTPAAAAETGRALRKANIFEGNIAYLRIASVDGKLAEEVAKACRELNATNSIAGIVLDLRYADGSDYSAAASTAELFISKAQPLLDWGQGNVSSQDNPKSIDLPLAILVNSGTSGSAEALAAVLRMAGEGLILGNTTAGRAMMSKNFPLKNGEELRITTAPVKLGNGKSLAQGVQPDIEVTVNPENERAYFANSFYVVRTTNQVAGVSGSTNSAAGTNGTRRVRLNEAELVREHRAGLDGETPTAAKLPAPEEKPVVTDPALARALDLLKGLAVVRQARS